MLHLLSMEGVVDPCVSRARLAISKYTAFPIVILQQFNLRRAKITLTIAHCTFSQLMQSTVHVVVVAALHSRAAAQPFLETAFSSVKMGKSGQLEPFR